MDIKRTWGKDCVKLEALNCAYIYVYVWSCVCYLSLGENWKDANVISN